MVEAGEQAVVELAGEVEHGAEVGQRREQGAHGLAVGDVARNDVDGGRAEGEQLGHQGGHAWRVGAAARREHEAAHAVAGDEVAGEGAAERPGAAGDQGGAAREVGRRRGGARGLL